jgi:hypothetical protein
MDAETLKTHLRRTCAEFADAGAAGPDPATTNPCAQ